MLLRLKPESRFMELEWNQILNIFRIDYRIAGNFWGRKLS